MSTQDFLRQILPGDGVYCVATPATQGFRHYFCDSIEETAEQIAYLDRIGETVYVAQASFDLGKIQAARKFNAELSSDLSKEEYRRLRKKERSHDNALYLKNFFLDIDCGDKWPLKTQAEAAAELKRFVEITGLPFPAVVNSGNGLYAHWIIDEMIPATSWRTFARILKAVVATQSPKIGGDSSRTADISSVLRPIGATHRKDPTNPKTVTLLRAVDSLPLETFVTALKKAAAAAKVDTHSLAAPKAKAINDEFFSGLDGPQSLASKVADKCPQIGNFRAQKGNVDEPFWYASLGVMVFCADGDDYIQDWSSGHPDYSPQATAAKAQQYLDSGTGPSTCAQFGSLNAKGCVGCAYNGKIKSPIVLGRPEPKAVEVEELVGGESSGPPPGFRRADDGLHVEREGLWYKFYDQDLYVSQVAYDESLGYQVATIRHHLPHEGWMEFVCRSSLIHDAKAMLTYFSDNHVHIIGVQERKAMVAYVESYLAQLARKTRMAQLLNQMGWKTTPKGEHLFVLGKKLLHQDGSIQDASLARNVPTAAAGYRQQGNVDDWVQATEVFNAPGMEAYAFALLCGLGAPLMKFTGFDGAMVSMVGPSGIGKTLLLRMIQSLYGAHNELMMLREDTKNALISRLGVYGNLPLTVDEITNIDGRELSDLVYRVTQGRDKARLTKNSEERKVLNHWNTIAVVSTNSSLVDKLSEVKHDASAELNRVFEYAVSAVPAFSGDVTSDLYWTITKNFGGVGERYINYLVQHVEAITPGLAAVQKRIDEITEIRGDERYWSALAATAIYGGVVAKRLGLLKFDVGAVMDWACKQIKGMRQDKDDLAGDAVSILGQYLDEHVNNRLLVKGSGRVMTVLEAPRGQLAIRYEVDTERLYFGRTHFKTWLIKRFGNYTAVKNELAGCNALKNPNRQKALGAGTSYAGATQPCWEIDMKNRRLGSVSLQVVQDAKDAEIRKEVEA